MHVKHNLAGLELDKRERERRVSLLFAIPPFLRQHLKSEVYVQPYLDHIIMKIDIRNRFPMVVQLDLTLEIEGYCKLFVSSIYIYQTTSISCVKFSCTTQYYYDVHTM